MDVDKSGTVSKEEFEKVTLTPKGQAWMSAMELGSGEINGLFSILQGGNGEINYDEFLLGAKRLRGFAHSVDMVILLHKQDRMMTELEHLNAAIRSGMSTG